jgi:membrane-associated protease RseP (regulator of RpoE activity)
MKRLILSCLLAMSTALAVAQEGRRGTDLLIGAEAERDAAKLTADEAKTRAKLDEARARLDKAAREVAELSAELGTNAQREVRIIRTGDRRAILGVNLDPEGGKDGAVIRSVSPGGPAEEAGLLSGDVIVSIDGETLTGKESSRALVDKMRKVKPDQKVKVRVLRAGKNKDVVVTARPMVITDDVFRLHGPEIRSAMDAARAGVAGIPQIRQFRYFWPGEFAGLELTSLTPKLGAYFGTSEGVLVVQAPENGSFKLEDGDVIQQIDGRKPEDGAHALRILRSYKPGEKLNLAVLRQKKPMTLAITMPERPEFDGDWLGVAPPPEPPMPGSPGLPPIPSTAPLPGGQGTFE